MTTPTEDEARAALAQRRAEATKAESEEIRERYAAMAASRVSTPPSEARVVFRPVDSDCGIGVCPKGCSHLMWACEACSCEGGWGASREALTEIAAAHRCPAPVPTEGEA